MTTNMSRHMGLGQSEPRRFRARARMPHAGTPRQPRANRGIPIRGVETDRGMLLSA